MNKIDVTDKDWDWLYKFAELHNLTSPEQCLEKLIEIYKSRNKE